MERFKILTEVEQAAKDYLKSLNIRFEAEKVEDDCSLVVDEKYGLFYVETNRRPYVKTLNPSDVGYCDQAQGHSCPVYGEEHSYRFVMDSNHKIVVDLGQIRKFWEYFGNNESIFADEQNIFLPIIDKDDTDVFHTKNKIQSSTLFFWPDPDKLYKSTGL